MRWSSARPPAAGAPPPRAAQRTVSTVARISVEGSRSWDPWPAKEAKGTAWDPCPAKEAEATAWDPWPAKETEATAWDPWPAKEAEAAARLPSADYFSEVKTQEHGLPLPFPRPFQMRSSTRPPAARVPPPRAAQCTVSTVAPERHPVEGSRSWDPWPAKEAEATARLPSADYFSEVKTQERGLPLLFPRPIQRRRHMVSTVAPERHPVEGSRSWDPWPVKKAEATAWDPCPAKEAEATAWDPWPAKEAEATARLPSVDYFSEVKTQEHGEKIKKYQGMLAARLMAKYFSSKTFEKGLFEEIVIESEIIWLSRCPFTSLFADPAKFIYVEKQVEELKQKNEQLIQTIDQVSSEGPTKGEADEVDMEEDTGCCYMLRIGGFDIALLLDDD